MDLIIKNINADDLKKMPEELLKLMSESDRKEAYAQLLKEWLDSPIDPEKVHYEQQAIDNIRKNNSRYYSETDSQIRDSWEFRDKISGYKNTKAELIKILREEAIKHVTQEASKIIKSSEVFNSEINTELERISKLLPEIIQKVFIAYFCSRLDSIGGIARELYLQQKSSGNDTASQVDKQALYNIIDKMI